MGRGDQQVYGGIRSKTAGGRVNMKEGRYLRGSEVVALNRMILN